MATAAAASVASLIFVVDGTAQMTLGQPYAPGSGSFVLSSSPSWPAASPTRPLAITLIEQATYAQGPLEVATMYAVTAVAGPVCMIGWVIEGIDRAYAAGDYAESRVGAAAVNGAALILAYDGSSAGQVLTSTGPASPPQWQAPAGGGGGSGTVSVAGAGQLGYYAASGATISGLSLGANLSITGGQLNAAGGGGGQGTVNPGTTNQLGYYAAAGDSLSGLTLGSNLSITGGQLNAAGAQGTVNAGATNQLGFYAGAGTAISGLYLGANLSIAGNTLNASSAGSGTVNTGIGNQLGFYAASGTAISGLSLGTGLSIAGNTLNAVVAALDNVVAGTQGQLGYYAGDGATISGLTLGANLSISGGVLSASAGSAGTGTVNPGAANQIGYYAANGTVISGIGLGSNLSISGGLLNATGGGQGTVGSGTADQLGYYAASGTSISGLTLGSNLSISGTTLNATGGGGSGTVVAGQGGQLGYYSANGTTISGVNVGANLSVAGGVLSAAGSGTVESGIIDQLAYYPASGTAVSGLTLGSLLSISGGVLNAAPGGSGTVDSGVGNQLAYYPANGTTISGVGLGSNLSISGGLLNATGGGSGTVNPGSVNQLGYYAAAGNSLSGLILGSNLSISSGVLNATGTGGGSGTVTTVSILAANGFSGAVQNPNTTPAISLGTSVTGLVKGAAGGLVAGVAGTDYQAPLSLTTSGTSGAASLAGNVLNIPQYSAGGGATGPASWIGGQYTGGTAWTMATTPFVLTTGSTLAAGRADIPANTLSQGEQLWFRANGVYTGSGAATQFQLQLVLDAAATPIVLLTSSTFAPQPFIGTALAWSVQGMVIVRAAGGAGSISGSATVVMANQGGASSVFQIQPAGYPPAPVAVDTTVAHTPTLRAIGLAASTQTVQLLDFTWAIVPPPAATTGGTATWVGGMVTGGGTLTNTTTAGDLVGPGTLVLGRGDLPAGILQVGVQYWFRGCGTYTWAAGGPTFWIRLTFDQSTVGTPILTMPLVNATLPAAVGGPWSIEGMFVVRSAGTTGQVSGFGMINFGSTAFASTVFILRNPLAGGVGQTVDTTVAHIPTLSPVWSAANATASITLTDFLWGLGSPPSAS